MAGIVEAAIPTAVAATEDGNAFRTHQQPPAMTSPSLSDSLIRSIITSRAANPFRL